MARKPRFKPRRSIKADPSLSFSYKQPELLKRYMTEQGEILPRTESNLTAKQQRELATAVKRARHLALVPYTQIVI